MINILKVKEFIDPRRGVETVSEDISLSKVKTIMILSDYSQLAVKTNQKEIKAISWKSIGKADLTYNGIDSVKQCLEEPVILNEDESFVKYLKLIAKKEFVLVQNSKKELTGIITTYDMTMRFNDFVKPYMQLGIIEESLRNLIVNKMGLDEVTLVNPIDKNKTQTKKIDDLTFFEYTIVIGKDENWKMVNLKELDKNEFMKHLESVREIRNKIAHYSPKPLTETEKYRLKVTSELFLKIFSE